MAMTAEARVKLNVKLTLKKIKTTHPVWFFMPFAGALGRIGVPDFVGVINGVFFAIETKSIKGKLTMLQAQTLEFIRAAGGVGLTVWPADLPNLEETLLGECKKVLTARGSK